jgi:hypothetical protein
MSIIVIEEGAPNGTDLVVGDHHLNPVARANAEPVRHVRAIPLGDGYVVIGLSLEPVMSPNADQDGDDFCAVLSLVGGRESSLMPTIPVKIILGELARLPLAMVKSKLAHAIDGEPKADQ